MVWRHPKIGLRCAAALIVLAAPMTVTADVPIVELPSPRTDGGESVEAALASRRSVRDFAEAPVSLAELGQLLWAAQGVTSKAGYRTAPSAGALYPLEVYAVVGNVNTLTPAVYRYRPQDHALHHWRDEDRRAALAAAALDQAWVRDAAAVIVFCAVAARTERKYGQRSGQYIAIEVGHAAQNVFLQAQSLGLAAVVVGAFNDSAVEDVLELPEKENVLYLMPTGRPLNR